MHHDIMTVVCSSVCVCVCVCVCMCVCVCVCLLGTDSFKTLHFGEKELRITWDGW